MVLTAGCLGSEPETVPAPDIEDDDTPPEVDATAPKVFRGTGTVVASAGPLATSQGGGTATVGDGATVLFVEWRWDDPVQDLDGALSSPSAGETQGVENIDYTASGGSPGNPDSPHTLTISAPEIGDWSVSMIANGGSAQVEYEFAATVFYGDVPTGYTAF